MFYYVGVWDWREWGRLVKRQNYCQHLSETAHNDQAEYVTHSPLPLPGLLFFFTCTDTHFITRVCIFYPSQFNVKNPLRQLSVIAPGLGQWPSWKGSLDKGKCLFYLIWGSVIWPEPTIHQNRCKGLDCASIRLISSQRHCVHDDRLHSDAMCLLSCVFSCELFISQRQLLEDFITWHSASVMFGV